MVVEAAYQKALDYLYSFVDHSLTRGLSFTPGLFELGKMRSLLERLGDPHTKYPVIHVAGTKGKGSTSALIANVLKEAGYRTGLYTSPHLHDFNERIQVNNHPITHDRLVEMVEKITTTVSQIPELSTFEIMTALAFQYFGMEKVDIAVIEVGLGGRLDSTNVVSPLISVITSLSMDHNRILGDTLAKVAGEKAGIIKPGRPVVVAPQQEEARFVVHQTAAEQGSPLCQVGRDIKYAPWSHSMEGQSLFVWPTSEQRLVDEFIQSGGMMDWEPLRLSIPLLGHHQVENATTAYAALQIARNLGYAIDDRAIKAGFDGVCWPGRFEILQQDPLVIVDSAHNRDSCLRLRLALDDYIPGQPVVLVFGVSEDKDLDGMFAELMPRVMGVIATASAHPRAQEIGKIVECAHKYGVSAEAVPGVAEAVSLGLRMAGNEAALVVAGSLFIAAETRELWFNKITTVHIAGN